MKCFRIISVYNRYLNRGGEDEVFESEASLLRQNGCKVMLLTEQVHDPRLLSVSEKVVMALNTIWSKKWFIKFKDLLKSEKPNVVHIHNFFPLFSPSIYYGCQEVGVPVVQRLPNYRLLCPTATFYQDGKVCEDCLGKMLPWPSILHACYHQSRVQTAVISAMLTVHRWLRTWRDKIDVYIALTEFARRKFIEGGLPAEKIVIKPNFVHPDPGMREGNGIYALFVGRLSPEKGLRTLLKAWCHLEGILLKIVGDGPLMDEVQEFMQFQKIQGVEVLGRKDRGEVITLMKGARFLVFPSEWYEGLPMTIIEAFACGVPVIASHLGAMAEIVEDERTGLHFISGDPEDLAAKVEWALIYPNKMMKMGQEARQEYERKYTAKQNYQMLMDIYQMAIKLKK